MEINRTQGLTTQSRANVYNNLQCLYNKHNYDAHHIWNLDATWIQACGQLGANILAKQGSQQVYIIIPKLREWLIVNCIINTFRKSLPRFYIFKREKIRDDYIKLCKQITCMAMWTKAWMTSFLFKKILYFFKRSVLRGISFTNRFFFILDGHPCLMSHYKQLNKHKHFG